MAYFNTGTVILDSQLQIVKGNKEFFGFIGWENSMFIEQSVYKDDFPEVKAICEKVWTTGGRMLITYRAFCADESMPWVVADVTKDELAGNDVLTMNIQAVDSLEQEICTMRDELGEIGAYLDILDELFFRYDVDKDDFCLFMGGEKQKVVIYSGDLDGWEQTLEGRKAFASEKYRETFGKLYQDLQQATRHFSHEIMLPHLVRGDEKELYLLKGRSIVTASGKTLVLGCIYTMSKTSHRRKTRLGADTVRDEMTGLLSRQTIIDYIQSTMDNKPEYNCYLCIMDIDNFKYVNDNYGHMFGDEVLITVADILKEAVGERGVVGRIGGDEMLIFLERIVDRADLKSILRTVRCNVEWAYKGIKDDLNLSCSIGVAAWPKDADNYDELFMIADKMLYRAKENGKNRYIIYTPQLHGEITKASSADASFEVNKRKHGEGSKERLLLDITECFMFRSIWNIQITLSETGKVFGLKEVNVFFDDPGYNAMHWRADGRSTAMEQLSYTNSAQFRQLFDENNLAVIDGVNNLQYVCPEIYEVLRDHQVTAAIIYRMDCGVPGYVTFFKEDQVSRMWSESDKSYLNLIGKMIALVIGGR